VKQSKQKLTGDLDYENPVTGDAVQSTHVDSVSVSGAHKATFSGECVNGHNSCTFSVTVEASDGSSGSFSIAGSGLTPESGGLTSGTIEVSVSSPSSRSGSH